MQTPDNEAPKPGADQGGNPPESAPNAELRALEKEMRAIDGAPAAEQSKQQTAVAISTTAQNRGELHSVLVMARNAALPMIAMRSERKAVMLAAIWSDDALAAIASSGAEVLALHGITLSNLTAGFGPYIALALSLGPCALGTVAVLKSPDPQPAEVVPNGQQQ